MRASIYIGVLFIFLGFIGCHGGVGSDNDYAWPEETYIPVPVSYKTHTNDSSMAAIKQDTLHRLILCMINRVDVNFLKKADTLIVPDTFVQDLFSYSPFPVRYKTLRPVRKMILYSQKIQAFAAYENGRMVRWGPISTGKKETPTPSRLYFTNWRARETVSTVDDEWIMEWYFNLGNLEGVSMHLYEMPGFPASHACVRLLQHDAMWFYEWCDEWELTKKDVVAVKGTPVLVFGEYDFDGARPWYSLPADSKALTLSEQDLDRVVKPALSIILNAQAVRDSLTLSQTTH